MTSYGTSQEMYIVCTFENLLSAGLAHRTSFPRVAGPGNQKHCVAEPEANWILEYLMQWSTTVSSLALRRQELHR